MNFKGSETVEKKWDHVREVKDKQLQHSVCCWSTILRNLPSFIFQTSQVSISIKCYKNLISIVFPFFDQVPLYFVEEWITAQLKPKLFFNQESPVPAGEFFSKDKSAKG